MAFDPARLGSGLLGRWSMAFNCAYVCTQDLVLSLDYMPLVKSMRGSVQVSRPIKTLY